MRVRVKYIIIPGGNDGCGTRARLEDDGKMTARVSVRVRIILSWVQSSRYK